jgi:hypothetical protein
MSMVRFATVCDKPGCTARSEEYTAWPSCEDCGDETCAAHMARITVEADGAIDKPQPEMCLCLPCSIDRETGG